MNWCNPPWDKRIEVTAQSLGPPIIPWEQQFLGIPALQKISRGAGVTVAICDTRIDENHPDFKDAIVHSHDFTSAPITDTIPDHGTWCAGKVGSRDNGQGFAGIAPDCKLGIYRIFDDRESGSDVWIAAGMRQAIADQCDILSFSGGSSQASPLIQAALLDAVKAGMLIVVAGGNNGVVVGAGGVELNTLGYPAAWGHLGLAVGALDQTGHIASFSSRGPQLMTMAPGVHCFSCLPNNSYGYLDGTSMACPQVAGALALALSYARANGMTLIQNQGQLEMAIQKTSLPPTGMTGPNFDWGFGTVNPAGLLGLAKAAVPATPAAPALASADSFHAGPINLQPFFPILNYSIEVTLTPNAT
jgi:subtilisin family serine protease